MGNLMFEACNRINYYQEAGQIHPQLDVSAAFRKALMTWGSWVDKHFNPRKTQVFFRSSAPSHFRLACVHIAAMLNLCKSVAD